MIDRSPKTKWPHEVVADIFTERCSFSHFVICVCFWFISLTLTIICPFVFQSISESAAMNPNPNVLFAFVIIQYLEAALLLIILFDYSQLVGGLK